MISRLVRCCRRENWTGSQAGWLMLLPTSLLCPILQGACSLDHFVLWSHRLFASRCPTVQRFFIFGNVSKLAFCEEKFGQEIFLTFLFCFVLSEASGLWLETVLRKHFVTVRWTVGLGACAQAHEVCFCGKTTPPKPALCGLCCSLPTVKEPESTIKTQHTYLSDMCCVSHHPQLRWNQNL